MVSEQSITLQFELLFRKIEKDYAIMLKIHRYC